MILLIEVKEINIFISLLLGCPVQCGKQLIQFLKCSRSICAENCHSLPSFLLRSVTMGTWIFIYLMFYNKLWSFVVMFESSLCPRAGQWESVHLSSWHGSFWVWVFPCFLLQQNFPISPCAFPTINLQTAISPRSPGLFHWGIIFRNLHLRPKMFIANGMSLFLSLFTG